MLLSLAALVGWPCRFGQWLFVSSRGSDRRLSRRRLGSLLLVLLLFLSAPVALLAADSALSARSRRLLYLPLVYTMASRSGLDPFLVDAVIRTESAYRVNAISRAGAVGLMQLMPGTARRYGVHNRFDPVQNVYGGTRYLADLLREFGVVEALAAYNAGEGTVRRYGGIPPYDETQRFVTRVLSRYVGGE